MRPAGRRTTSGAIVRALAGSSARGLRLHSIDRGPCRRGVRPVRPVAMAGCAEARRLARDLRCGDARPRAGSHVARSRDSRPAGPPARAGGIRADARRVSEGDRVRPARRAGPRARRKASRDAGANRAALRRAGRDRAGDLGARDQLRRGEDAAQRGPRACDAGVSRAPQGAVPRGVPARAEDARRGPRHAREHALILGRRDGPAAASAVGLLQIRDRLRRRRQARHLDLGAGCARHHRQSSGRARLAARHALGLRGEGAARDRLHHRAARREGDDRRMAQARLSCRRAARGSPRQSLRRRPRC